MEEESSTLIARGLNDSPVALIIGTKVMYSATCGSSTTTGLLPPLNATDLRLSGLSFNHVSSKLNLIHGGIRYRVTVSLYLLIKRASVSFPVSHTQE